ncbi:MAG: response regulator [Acidobacteriaceae bacterium]|nr:response regulator [Acidobacteriaceae bacterium]
MARAVLIVEDGNNIAPLEIALGSLNGVKVVVVSNGRDALELLYGSSIEIAAVVTDLHLPYVDGFELVEAIRSHTRYSRLPVVVVSGDSHPETSIRVRRLGADAFFPKPYSPAEIRHTLEALLDAP